MVTYCNHCDRVFPWRDDHGEIADMEQHAIDAHPESDEAEVARLIREERR